MHEISLLAVKEAIAQCEARYHRPAGAVKLLAVSKGQPIQKIKEAIALGQKAFGENYLQEALPKIRALGNDALEWHFIGTIQANKTRAIAEHFAWVHSITTPKQAKRLHDQRPAHLPPLNICLEINISHETTKSGIQPDDIIPLADYCQPLQRLRLRGLMTIPAKQSDFIQQRAAYHKLFLLWQYHKDRYAWDTLSMGMSDDMEAAIAEGSTLVRIGTAIFGPRAHP